MRYLVKTVRQGKVVPNRSVALAVRVTRVPAPVHGRMFEAPSWPGTSRDVSWSSDPSFLRSPAGWCRVGFFA